MNFTLEEKIQKLYSEIYTNKVTKSKQESAFLKIIDALPDDAFNELFNEISGLYREFIHFDNPKPTKENIFNKILPTLAKSKDDAKLQSIYSNGEKIMATNGIFAIFKTTKLKEGYYGKDLVPLRLCGSYPELEKLLIKNKYKHDIKEMKLYRDLKNSKNKYICVDNRFYDYSTFNLINMEGTKWYICSYEGLFFLYGEMDEFQLIILPIRKLMDDLIEIPFK